MRNWPILACVLGLACTQQLAEEREVICRFNDTPLFADELQQVIPEGLGAQDSTLIAERYIRNWLTEQAVLFQAENSLSPEEMDFTEALEQHREVLLTHAYEEALIRERLDTAVVEREMYAFYQQNRDLFTLREPVFQVRYCELDSGNWSRSEFRTMFRDTTDASQETLEAFCVRYRGGCFLDDERWVSWTDLQQRLPLDAGRQGQLLKKDKTVELQVGNRLFFLTIRGFMPVGVPGPYALQKDRIRGLIINQRKAELLAQMRQEVYRQAIKKNQITTVDDTP